MNTKLLEEIGLTASEIKVYFALLELGSSKKGLIVKKAGITSSKIYEVMDKLISKGLASYVEKDGVKYFNAASPTRIKAYLEEKKEGILKQEKEFNEILPQLELKQKFTEKETDAEVYRGWKGMHTVYNDLLLTMKRGEPFFIFGAGRGEDEKKVRSFFNQFNEKSIQHGLHANIIFNENARGNISNVKKAGAVRYLEQTTPAEILIYKNKTAIVLLEKEPLVILIRGENVAKSFKAYFDAMWLFARE